MIEMKKSADQLICGFLCRNPACVAVPAQSHICRLQDIPLRAQVSSLILRTSACGIGWEPNRLHLYVRNKSDRKTAFIEEENTQKAADYSVLSQRPEEPQGRISPVSVTGSPISSETTLPPNRETTSSPSR